MIGWMISTDKLLIGTHYADHRWPHNYLGEFCDRVGSLIGCCNQDFKDSWSGASCCLSQRNIVPGLLVLISVCKCITNIKWPRTDFLLLVAIPTRCVWCPTCVTFCCFCRFLTFFCRSGPVVCVNAKYEKIHNFSHWVCIFNTFTNFFATFTSFFNTFISFFPN